MAENPFRPIGTETLTFDGKSQYRTIPSSPEINFARDQEFTVAVQVCPDPTQVNPTNGDNDIVEKWNCNGGYPFVIRYIVNGPSYGQIAGYRWDGVNQPTVRSKTLLKDRKFHHVALVRRIESGRGMLCLYIDGKLEDSVVDTTTGNTQNSSPLYLGCRGYGSAGMNYFAGQIKGLEVYSRALTPAEIAAKGSNKPNILLIVADDLGVDALRINDATGEVTVQLDGPGGHGAGPKRLPTFEKLIKHGMHFAQAWAQPVCAPSRASLFTGLHPWRNGVGFAGGNYKLPAVQTTGGTPIQSLAEVLSVANYRCGIFGKWHLGEPEPGVKRTPIDWGWSRFEGILGGGLAPVKTNNYGFAPGTLPIMTLNTLDDKTVAPSITNQAATINKRVTVKEACKKYLQAVAPDFVEKQPDIRYYIWEKDMEDKDTGTRQYGISALERTHMYATRDQIHSAKDWIKSMRGTPWCAALTLLVPHDPFHVPPKESYDIQFKDPAKPSVQEMFVAMMQSMDFYLGQLLNSPEPEIQEQLKNTVIIFVGDNGTQDDDADYRRPGVEFGELLDTDLKDKGSHYIGGVHVPMFITDGGSLLGSAPCYLSATGTSPAVHGVTNNLVHIVDIFKTCVEIAGGAAPSGLDSVSLVPYLTGASGEKRTYNFSQQYGPEKGPVAVVSKFASISDGTYKLSCVRTKAADTRDKDEFQYEFFKLEKHDKIPGALKETEIKNFHCDAAYLQEARRLHEELKKYRLDGGSPQRPPLPFPELPTGGPMVDVYFLSDTTVSMATTIERVRQDAKRLLDYFKSQPGMNLACGVASYRDLGDSSELFKKQLEPTTNFDQVQAALATWQPSGGGSDVPEAQLYALYQLGELIGTNKLGWRRGAERVIVWFGDAPGHSPLRVPIPETPGDLLEVTEEMVIARLQAATITVLAINVGVAGGGLDATGQATRIAQGTGGKVVTSPSPDLLIQTVQEALALQMPAASRRREKTSLNQFAYVPGTNTYRFGHNSIPNIPITGAPADTDWTRWSMLHDRSAYRLYIFKAGSNTTLYQFAFNGSSYAYGHQSLPEVNLVGMPADADTRSFAMLHDGSAYRLYLRQRGNPQVLYQFAWVPGTATYQWGYNSIPTMKVTDFPADADWSRWTMLHDGSAYRLYVFKSGTNTQLYQGAFNQAVGGYQYSFNSMPEMTLVGTPPDSDTASAAMLFDGTGYRFYFQTR